MIKNYLVIAWRTLLRNRLFSFINILGLALSMSIGMMVMIRMVDDFQYDNFHSQSNRIFRIISQVENSEGNKWKLASTPLPLSNYLSSDSAILEEIVSLYPALNGNVNDGLKDIHVNGAFSSANFFKVFGFSLIHGDEQTALLQPFSIVLSYATAQKFFTDQNPVGKILNFEKFGNFQITGIMKEPPGKSHIHFDALISSSTIDQLEQDHLLPALSSNWDSFEKAYTYVLMREEIPVDFLRQRLSVLSKDVNKNSTSGSFKFETQSLSTITPSRNDIYNDIGGGGSWGKHFTEVGIALIILLTACINYTNLSIARAITRGREVGIRKIAGAAKWQIFLQYIIEAMLIAFFSLFLAQIFLSFILEYKPFNDGYEMVPEVQISLTIFLVFLLFAIFAGLLAGSLPAWILSSFKPARILKNISVEKLLGNMTLRKTLMVFQFVVSMVILIFLSAFYKQFSFMASADPGFARDHIITIPFRGGEHVLRSELVTISGVEAVASLSGNFGKYVSGRTSLTPIGERSTPINVNYYYADSYVMNVMGLKLLAGSNFPDGSKETEQYILLNEKAIHNLGYPTPAEAIGESIMIDSSQVIIQGVFQDFYYEGIGNPITPLALRNKTGAFQYLIIKVNPTAHSDIVLQLEQTWKKVFPDRAFAYSWLNKDLQQMHDQTATISLLGFLGFMTVTIATLGLLGLVVYTVETKRKEISIRKIIGASIHQLIALLSRGFAKLILIAGVIAMPVGYLLSTLFLQNFANRITLGVGSVILCFMLLLAIGLFTIISQTYQAATDNPVDNLRSE